MNYQRELRRNRKRKARCVRRRLLKGLRHPRLSVYRSHRYIYAQVIDDRSGRTLAAASSLEPSLNVCAEGKAGKTGIAETVGSAVAERARQAGVEKVVFDRGPYKYHGRVRALADAARKGGLNF